MPGDETLQKREEGSDSEEEEDDDEVVDELPTVEIDISKLSPLSPEVISKQVRLFCVKPFILKGTYVCLMLGNH